MKKCRFSDFTAHKKLINLLIPRLETFVSSKEVSVSDHIQEILDAMHDAGCMPRDSNIIIDDKKHRFIPKDHKKPSGVYCFKFCGDDVIGWFKDHRQGVVHKYISRKTREYSPEERAEFKKRMEAERKARDRRIEKEHAEMAAICQNIWKKAQKSDTHPYCERKGIKPLGAKVYKGMLVIPGYKSKKITTLQFITPDGEKRLKKDADASGAYGAIAGDQSVIYISAAHADAVSVHEATGNTSAWCFGDGNIMGAAKEIRQNSPDANIVICCDNDQWTVLPHTGELYNSGIDHGFKAAIAIDASVIWPDFAAELGTPDDKGPTDFNDYAQEYGHEKLRERLLEAKPPHAWGGVDSIFGKDVVVRSEADIPSPPPEWLDEYPPIEAYEEDAKHAVALYEANDETPEHDPDWKAQLVFDKHGNIHPQKMNNVRVMLESSPRFRDLFCYDEFSHEKMVVQSPPWEIDHKRFKPRPLCDEDVTQLAMKLEDHGITLHISTIKKVLDAVIKKHRRNPAREYFKNLEWDGTPRLDTWLRDYLGARSEDPEYLAMVGRKWLTAAVARIFNPGEKFDHMLILDGPQGKGKSTALRELATIHGREYFDDTVKANDLGLDRVVPKLQGVLIIEIQEMSGLSKVDMDNFKAQITVRDDRIVRKYQNEPVRLPRQFVLAGTINPIEGYLDDPTGLRRFWPVQVLNDIDIKRLKNDKEQLWAEAVHLHKNGEKLWLPKQMQDKLDAVHASRRTIDPWLPDIEELIGGRDFISKDELWRGLGFEKSRKNSRDAKSIAKIMMSLGFEESRPRMGERRVYGWQRNDEIYEEELPLN